MTAGAMIHAMKRIEVEVIRLIEDNGLNPIESVVAINWVSSTMLRVHKKIVELFDDEDKRTRSD